MTFNFEEYKREALLVKQNAKKKRKEKGNKPENVKHKSGRKSAVGSSYPNVISMFGWNRYGIRELEETVRVAPIARSIWQMQLVAFPYFEFNIVAPRGIEVGEKDKERILHKLEEVERRINTTDCCKQTMHDVMTYGSAFFEIVWGEDEDGWLVPTALQRLPASSFVTAPSHASGNTTRYQTGHLLKGVVLDKNDGSYHYYQVQDNTKTAPIEIPAANIIHIKDNNNVFIDGEPYLAGIVSTIAQLEVVRKNMMQTISRVGAPQAKFTVGVPNEYLEMGGGITSALPGESGEFSTAGDDFYTQLWEYAAAMAENYSHNVATVIPKGIEMDWQRASVPMNPMDSDQYLIREAINHIFPRDFLEVLGNSISSTSQPLLNLLELMVHGWQQICSIPFENRIYTRMLLANGFKNYRVEFDWAPFLPEDEKAEEERTLQKWYGLIDRNLVTMKEFREAVGLPVDNWEELKKEIYDEMLARKVPQSLMQQAAPLGAEGEMGGLEAMMGGAGGEEEMATEEEASVGEEDLLMQGGEEEIPEEDATISDAEDLLAQLESEGYQ